MSKFFRSSSSSTSSSEDGPPSNQDESNDTGEAIDGTSDGTDSITTSLRPLGPGNDDGVHSQMLLHALLEERCMNEALREHERADGTGGHHSDAAVRATADAKYQWLCGVLAPRNLIAPDLERESLAAARQRYRDGLDLLSHHAVPSHAQKSSVTASPRPLLTSYEETASQLVRVERDPLFEHLAPTHPMLEPSRYTRDGKILGKHVPSQERVLIFDELGVLGRGGFGVVYHVRHRLDGLEYAVKKVPIASTRSARISSGSKNDLDEILRELRTLARLDHPNVVRYFAGWIEWADVSSFLHGSDGSVVSRVSTISISDDAAPGATDDSLVLRDGTVIRGPDGIRFESSRPSRDSGPSLASSPSQMRMSPNSPGASRSSHQDLTSSAMAATEAAEKGPIDKTNVENAATGLSVTNVIDFGRTSTFESETSVPAAKPPLALHLQMGLYPMTLADFINPNPDTAVKPLTHCFHVQPTIAILMALLDGVEYLHSQGIVHRDLKPANIFIAANNNPRDARGVVDLFLCSECRASGHAQAVKLNLRIGDFGLVTTLAQPTSRSPNNAGISHDAAIGTRKPLQQPDISTVLTALALPSKKSIAEERKIVNDKPHAVGTALYRPLTIPDYNTYLDAYALGIIAFELLYKCSTRMERHDTIQALKQNNTFPPHFVKNVGPRLAGCIRKLLVHDPRVTLQSLREELTAVPKAPDL
ncbi:hypothetical protein LTR15_000705 [Elasticomyces elasticus]|nr:hypothetical protein LTR15_000705 [Elasticomyces elasticus]